MLALHWREIRSGLRGEPYESAEEVKTLLTTEDTEVH